MTNAVALEKWRISAVSSDWADDYPESVFFIGNGRMGVRGYLPFEPALRPVRRGMFVAGIFGEIKPGITDFVNLPTPVWEQVLIDGEQAALCSDIRITLDLKRATFLAACTLQANEKRLDVEYARFFSSENTALLFQQTTFVPQADMTISLASGVLKASVNCPVPDDQTQDNTERIQLARAVENETLADGFTIRFAIRGSGQWLTQTVRFSADGWTRGQTRFDENSVTTEYKADAKAGERIRFDKLACILTSRDVDPRIEKASAEVRFDDALARHEAWWRHKWEICDLPSFAPEEETQTALRYNIYQLIANCSAQDPTVGVGARGLTHTRYKGCYFWDTDLFMLPFYLETDRTAAYCLCEYRVGALPAAKAHARKMNTRGARYPWMAALDGTEQCETWDIGCSELHVTADVAYALASYCAATGDEAFYLDHAAEVLIETARFWRSRYTFDPESGRCDLLFCKGPDEYCGVVNNNLFTNAMARYNLELACAAAKALASLRPARYDALGLTVSERDDWQRLHDCIRLPRDPNTGRLTTDDNFHLLEPVDVSALKPDLGAAYHHVCFDRLQRYKVVKQADVLLAMTRLPDRFTDAEKREAWADFEPICLHDSTLSFASHALFAAMNGLNEPAKAYFEKALFLDLRDLMGNTGKEGLHLACMGETWQAAKAILAARREPEKR